MWTYGRYNGIIQKLCVWGMNLLCIRCLCVSVVYECVGMCVGVLLFV